MSVEMERRARCGGSGCDSKISVVGGALCVVNEGLGEAMESWGEMSCKWFEAVDVSRLVGGGV